MDYTRLTQNGAYEGWVEVAGKRIEIKRDAFLGTRDRSWGVRPIGLGDPQGVAPPRAPQFYWLWSPLNFPDRFMLYHNNADGDGSAWNTASVIGELGEKPAEHMASCRSSVDYKSGTRHAKRCIIETRDARGGEWRAELNAKYNFYMSGIGYGHPEWSHGRYKGENEQMYDSFKTADVSENLPHFQHIQAFVTATLTGPGVKTSGVGILEQLVIGVFEPHGLKDVFDPAP
jgi:hypothetical protein